MTPEDEEFEAIDKAQGWRKRQVADQTDVDPYTNRVRNCAIEEVARAVEQFSCSFGPDTVASFAVYIRGLKK